MLYQNSSDLQHQRNTQNLYLYCFKNCIYLLNPQCLQEGEESSICKLPGTGNVCKTVYQLRKRGQQDNPASSAMSSQRQSQGTREVSGAGGDPARCGVPPRQREHRHCCHCHPQAASHPPAGPRRAFEDGWMFFGQNPVWEEQTPSASTSKHKQPGAQGQDASHGRCQPAPTTGMCSLRHRNQKT